MKEIIKKIDVKISFQKIIFSILIMIIIILLSCSRKPSVNEDGTVLCDCKELVLDETLNIWLFYNKPYTGDCETYYHSGIRESYSSFKEGKINGTLISYYENGKIEESVDYVNNIPNGMVVYYFQNGDTSEFGKVKNDMKIGEWIGYHQNGKIMYKHNWHNDLLNDSTFDYYENGIIKMKGYFIQGKANGLWTFYDSLTGGIDGYLEYRNDSVIRNYNQ